MVQNVQKSWIKLNQSWEPQRVFVSFLVACRFDHLRAPKFDPRRAVRSTRFSMRQSVKPVIFTQRLSDDDFPYVIPCFKWYSYLFSPFFSYLSKDFLLVPWGKQNLRFDKHKRLRLQLRLFQNLHETWEQLAIRGSMSGPLVEIWNGLFSCISRSSIKKNNLARNTTLHPTESQQFLDQTSPYQSSSAHCKSYSLAG